MLLQVVTRRQVGFTRACRAAPTVIGMEMDVYVRIHLYMGWNIHFEPPFCYDRGQLIIGREDQIYVTLKNNFFIGWRCTPLDPYTGKYMSADVIAMVHN